MTDAGSPERGSPERAGPERAGLRGRGAWLAALAVLLLAGGGGLLLALRSDSGSDAVAGSGELDEVGGVPVLAGAYRTDGDLADGLVVPPESALLGDVLPADDISGSRGELVEGWRAQLLVVGDLADALDDLERQAAEIGLEPVQHEYFVTGCVVNGYQPPEGTITCRRAWQTDTLGLTASITRGVVPAEASAATNRPVSLLSIELAHLTRVTWSPPSQTPGAESSPLTTEVRPTPPTTMQGLRISSKATPDLHGPPTTTPDEPMPEAWPPPPGPGERLGDGIVSPDHNSVISLRVPAGAHAVIAPWPTGGNAENYEAIMAVTGDVQAVMDDLAGQILDRLGPPEVSDESTTVGGAEIRTVHGAAAGGDSYEVTAVTVNGRSWITVSTRYD